MVNSKAKKHKNSMEVTKIRFSDNDLQKIGRLFTNI